jgi:hypothetical protein
MTTRRPAPMPTVPVYAAHERLLYRPSRAARHWRVFRRRQLPFLLLALGFLGLMAFGVSLAEVTPDLRGGAALGVTVSALIAARGLRTAPGGIHAYVDLPGGRR